MNGRGEGVAFEEARDEIRQLLSPYRLGNSQPKPEHPFVYLGQTPEIWSVRDSKGQDIAEMIAPIDSTSRTPARETLSFLKAEAVGSLSPRFVAALGDPEVLDAIVKELLKRSVPESEYTMLLEKVRLLNHVRLASAPWDSAFKDMVVMAYRYRCSFCDFSARLQNRPVGLDAVPVRIPAKGGPKDLSNAVTLCSRDHKLFAAGALGLGFVGAERRVLVSQHLRTNLVDLVSFSGQKMYLPRPSYPPPARDHIEWHYGNLFLQPERRLTPSP